MRRNILALLSLLLFLPAIATDNAMEYTYVGDQPIVYYGTRRVESYDLAIKFDNPALAGKRITAIRAQVNSPAQEISNCSVWLTSELLLEKNENGKKVNVPNILTQSATLSEDGWIEATLDEPYTLTEEPIYVGYTFTNSVYNEENRGPIAYSQNRHMGGFFIHTSMTVIKWKDYEETLKGVLPVFVTVEDGYGDNQMAVTGYGTEYPHVQVDVAWSLPFRLYNIGLNEINSIDYSYEVDGRKGSNHIDFASPLTPNITDPYTVKLPIDAIDNLGSHTLNIAIDQVNGQANTANMASRTLPIEVKELVPIHRTLLEEGTGAWCSACPRGAVAIKELNRLYPENFIGIAYHSKDPMMVMAEFPVDFPHFPAAYINRGRMVDPYFGADNSQNDDFAIEPLIVEDFSQPAIAAINVASTWADEEKTAINAQAYVAFTTDITDHEYRVSFVLVGNGLCGEGKNWSQVNSLSRSEADKLHPLLRPLADAGNPIEGYIFDDVVLISKEPYGIESSLPLSMPAFKWHNIDYNFQLADAKSLYTPDATLIQDKEQLEVVAMLIDSETGKVVNAAKAHVGKKSAVKEVSSSATKISTLYYDLQGIATNRPSQGIYIVVDTYDDGTVKSHKDYIR